MTPSPLSVWHQARLAFLRVLSIVLGIVDSFFNVHWGERILGRMANHWQTQLVQLDQALAHLEEERQRIQSQAEALSIHAATIYLGGRILNRGELRFDPADSHDEELLDATIELLVKQRLAAIESEEIDPGRFVYNLEPDWSAIQTYLSKAAEMAEPETAEWFRESLRFIDEEIQLKTVTQRDHRPSQLLQE